MRVKSVVKVMNFHSLLRVSKSRKEAEKYFAVEKQLRIMIDSIANNRNIILDKRLLKVDESKPVLNIYVGSDLGFCGAYNYIVKDAIKKDNSIKIIIGKKVKSNKDNIILSLTKEEYTNSPDTVYKVVDNAIKNNKYSEINVVYNNYINVGQIEFTTKRVYPFKFEESKNVTYTEDYMCETSIDDLLKNMISTYVDYEIQIIIKNSFASENIMRQNSTNESLKKIDEIEEQQAIEERRQKTLIASKENIERYQKRLNGQKEIYG